MVSGLKGNRQEAGGSGPSRRDVYEADTCEFREEWLCRLGGIVENLPDPRSRGPEAFLHRECPPILEEC